MVEVYIEPITAVTDVPLPSQNHPGEDAGYDLHYCGDTTVLWPSFWPFFPSTKALPVNCKIAMPPEIHAHVRGRSGLAKKGILVQGGTIDSGFRGQIHVIMTNLSWLPRIFRRGDRIGQIVFLSNTPVEWNQVSKLPNNSLRGERGFGSSGLSQFTRR